MAYYEKFRLLPSETSEQCVYKLLLEIAFNVMQRAIRSSGHNNNNNNNGETTTTTAEAAAAAKKVYVIVVFAFLYSKVDLVCFLNDFVAIVDVEAFRSLAFSDKF